MDKKRLNELLDKIDDALGHYAGTGSPAPPYIKTDDKAIEEAVKEIRKEVKPTKKDVFVTNEEIVDKPYCFGNYSDGSCNQCSAIKGCIEQLDINNAEYEKRKKKG